MKKLLLLLSLAFAALASPALAANCSSYPFTLTNGQVADANQVMSNFSSILTCANTSLAHNGANSDITSINGLTTPLSVAQGGTGGTAGVVTSFNTRTGAITPTTADYTVSQVTGAAPLASPTFTGTPAAPTASPGTNTTQLATTAYVVAAAVGGAPLASPAFTGVPTAPTASTATNTTQIATTAYVQANLTGLAPLASPALTGSPTIGGVAIVVTTDARFGGTTQNGQCTYGLILTDAGKQIYCNTAGTHTLTIPANGSVAFPVGTKIDVVNDCSAGVMTVAITTDTLVLFTAGTTGSRSLSACAEATLSKVTSTRWVIVGTGVT